jgi:putative transposase
MLLVNQVIASVYSEAPFDHPARVLWISREHDLVTFITTKEPFKAPWSTSLSETESMIKAEKLRLTSVRLPAFMMQHEEDLSETTKRVRARCWEVVQPLVEGLNKDRIYYPGALGGIVTAHAKLIGKGAKSVYRLLYRYLAYGSTRNAFLPAYANSGAPGKTRSFVSGKKPGRPRMHLGERATTSAKLLTDEDKAIIKVGYSLFKDNKVKHISDAYVKTLNRFYRAEHPAPDGSDDGRPLRTLDQVPTETQFQYWGKKAFDEMDIKRGRKGERRWALDHRPLVGTAHQGLRGPCHRFEIDATIADIYLVSRFNKNWIIGRPVVYVVVDVFSRMIVGVHVALEGPSWNSARHALFNALTDKVEFCASYGIPIKTEDWPCCHLPHELVGDRGEMIGNAPEGMANGLKIILDTLPPFRGDWKGTVESTFRILNNLTQVHWTPGAVRAREKERGERDYRLDATLNLHEFTAILIKAIMHRNHHVRDPNRLSKDMIDHGVDPTAIGIWNWAEQQGLIEPNIVPRESVYLHLLPRAKGTVQAGGIFFNGMIYSNVLDPTGKRAARARANGREPIDLWYEPDADHVWIRDNDGSFFMCPLRGSEVRFRGMRREEVLDMLAITTAVSTETKYAELNSRVELDEFIESTIATAGAERKQTNVPTSKAKKLGDLREKRQLERNAERHAALERSPGRATIQVPREDTVSKDLSTVREYAGERGAAVISLLSRAGKVGNK